MRNRKFFGLGLVVAGLLLIVACGGDSDGPVTPPAPQVTMPDALEDYWETQSDISGTLTQMGETMDAIEVALSSGDKSDSEIETLVNRYIAQTEAAAGQYDQLIEMENAIVSFGDDKNMFSDLTKSVVVGVFNTCKKVVVSSGQQLRTGWNVLSGRKTLREALRDPDSGIPIISDMAKRLKEHNDQRDAAILQTIEANDSHDGLVPIDQLPGANAAERAEAYRNLPDDHQLKKEMRGGVHFWHEGEKAATVVTLKKATRDQIKNYVGAISGSDELVEIGDQMTNPNQPPTDRGSVESVLRDAETLVPVTQPKTMIIAKRDQPEHAEKVAVLQGVDPDFSVSLPSGTYDVILMAENYIRSAATEIIVTADHVQTALLEMHERVSNSLVLEGVTADPAVATIDEVVSLRALAASTIGENLTFEWTVGGAADVAVSGSGPNVSFTPELAGNYTAQLTVSDGLGNQKQGSATVQVIGGSIEVNNVVVDDGAFADGEINPGEQVTVNVNMINRAAEATTANVALATTSAITFASDAFRAVTLDPGESLNWPVTITLPVNFNRDELNLVWSCTLPEAIIEQQIQLPVVFWAEIDPIASPVTDRVLTITGQVANPSLATAWLVVDEEADQVYEVSLSNGVFSQTVVLEGAVGQRTVGVNLVADSGSWREEHNTSFTANISAVGFRVMLTWDTPGTDVDLWVTDPDGEKCYYSNTSTASGLSLDVDDTDGYGPENITNATPPEGNYLVQVHYYDDNDDEEANPSNCQITIWLNEGTDDEEIRGYSGSLSDTDDVWTVTTLLIGSRSGPILTENGTVEPYGLELPAK